jgi:virginiamycin B lyase
VIRYSVRLSACAAVMTASLALAAIPLAAQETAPDFNEWNIPWERTRPRDPYVGADGRIWFVGQAGHYVAVLDPATSALRRYELDPGTGPHNVIVGADGMVWYSGNLTGHIGRLDPRDGSITRFPMPDPAARDPHTMVFDAHGDIWFTVQNGNFIGKLTVASGEVRLVRARTARSRPYGILLDPAGRPWVVLFGTNRIATVDPASFELTEYELPRAAARPRRLAITTDGAIWYGDYAAGMLGRFDPATREIREWPLPGGATSRPYAMASDADGRVWLVETGAQPNRFVAFDSRSLRWVSNAPVPSGGGTVRHMVFDPARRMIWFGADAGTIGRAVVPPVRAAP